MQKKLLVISYTFPPSNKVGGRRWSKFSKYLIKSNIDVRILTSYNNIGEQWEQDLLDLKDKIDFINFNYPKHLGIYPLSIFHKFLYKASLIYSKLSNRIKFMESTTKNKSKKQLKF